MTPTIRHKHNTVILDNAPLVTNAVQKTFLTADVAASAGTITVKNISGFAIDQCLLIGELGHENSEILLTHASTAPSGTTVTFASNTVKAHSAGTSIYVIQYNQVEISHAATLAGSKSVLSTTGIQADAVVQVYEDVTQTSGYYFARYKDTADSAFSGYSDGVIYNGYASNAVGYMIDKALHRANKTLSNTLTKDFCYSEMNEGIRFVQGKQKHWPEHYVYNYIGGQAQRGINVLTLPTNIYDTSSGRSMIAIRIGDGPKLRYVDPIEYEQRIRDVKNTQVLGQAVATDTSLSVDNSYDFKDTGNANFYIGGVKYSFTYTGITRDDLAGTTGAFTGIPASGDGSITVTVPVDTYIWQDEQEGYPEVYTVRNGNIEFYYLVDSTYDNANIYLDYAIVVTEVDSDNDVVDFGRYDMLLDYLTWKIRVQAKNDGVLDMNDGYYLAFKEKLNNAIRTSETGIVHKMKPKINSMGKQPFRGSGRGLYSTDL